MAKTVKFLVMAVILGGFSFLSTSCDKEIIGKDTPINLSQDEFVLGCEGGTIELDHGYGCLIWLSEVGCLYSDNASNEELNNWENHLEFEKTNNKESNYYNNEVFSMTVTMKHIKVEITPNPSSRTTSSWTMSSRIILSPLQLTGPATNALILWVSTPTTTAT